MSLSPLPPGQGCWGGGALLSGSSRGAVPACGGGAGKRLLSTSAALQGSRGRASGWGGLGAGAEDPSQVTLRGGTEAAAEGGTGAAPESAGSAPAPATHSLPRPITGRSQGTAQGQGTAMARGSPSGRPCPLQQLRSESPVGAVSLPVSSRLPPPGRVGGAGGGRGVKEGIFQTASSTPARTGHTPAFSDKPLVSRSSQAPSRWVQGRHMSTPSSTLLLSGP